MEDEEIDDGDDVQGASTDKGKGKKWSHNLDEERGSVF